MKASQNNDFVHEVGLTIDETVTRYTAWAKDYEKDLCEDNFRGPSIVADRVCELFPNVDEYSSIRILDVAAGTGVVGEKLKSHGFSSLDALEPSHGMMTMLRQKALYRQTFEECLNGDDISIRTDSYDAAVISGGMGEGHIPCIGLKQLARVVKPGGYVVVAMREEYLQTVTEYKDKLEPFMHKLEVDGVWSMLSRKVIPKYSFNNDGVVYTFHVRK